ncbi:leucine-rich repeat-containing protein 43-like isoform X2 [Gigantopelta aegis]|uniref:leucine-rich repeat-containing protein 43-like isoform X2 n=1 Tax=Gigantopelta aegis TaxID=1735272 RepID=UPI001B88E183|nr:leucine-rich repeat-containing protein 43-like isoform X2 [Gigantopelta aegis]
MCCQNNDALNAFYTMTAVEQYPAFSAFENQLKTLCLKEFPCGIGSWRESGKTPKDRVTKAVKVTKVNGIPQVRKKSFKPPNDPTRYEFSVTHQDYVVQHVKTESLQEYVTSKFSPWHLDYSWSEEAKQLREIAVKSPWLIDDNFILNHFRTIRILDKNVTEVDPNILKFQNLEELTLSANYIQNIPSKNLPSMLKVLELCANDISDISSLCEKPPRLTHLGLGFNKITYIKDYLTGDYWPNLLSLDLSHNNLSDLVNCVRKLSSLPKLRNLILQGNPLSLIPGYRGYIIDVMRKLSILDDISISADEKHHFKGLARRKEYILDEAKIILEVSTLKGLPMPEEIKNPEDQLEYPIIERTFFVQFMFLEDSESKLEVCTIPLQGSNVPSTLGDTERKHVGEITEREVAESHSEETGSSQLEKNVAFNSKADMKTVENIQDTDLGIPSLQLDDDVLQTESSARKVEMDEDLSKVNVAPIRSAACTWAEEVELKWSTTLFRDNLLALRNFFKQGMKFKVLEQVILCYPLEEEESDNASNAGSRKGARTKTPEKKGGKKDDKKKKKKGEPELKLRRTPPQIKLLASFHMPLEDFLEGEFEYEKNYIHGSAETASTIASRDSPEPGKKNEKKDKDGKKKEPLSPKRKDAKGAPKGKEPDKKVDKKRKSIIPPTEDEVPEIPPPPLEVQVAVRLHHWTTAQDSLKEEEEKKQALQEGN